MLLASVIVDIPARALNRAFDYYVPDALETVEVGCTVSVDFGNRPVVGYVVSLAEVDEAHLVEAGVAVEKLKPLAGVLSEPYFDEVSAKLASWISSEYLCALPDAVHLFTPPGGTPKIKRDEGVWTLHYPGVGPVDDRWVFATDEAASFTPRKGAVKQEAVLEALAFGGVRVAELSLQFGAVNSTLTALEKKGIVRIEHHRRLRQAMEGCKVADDTAHVELTEGQREAVDTVLSSGSGDVVVIDGITGSGKTEVYLRAIESCLDEGKSACVLVPEISLTPQTVGRFRARFGDDVAVLHSRLSTGERFDQWDLIRTGNAHVVVGARSALFAPLHNLGLIIIDEEHESSYKQDSQPRYSAREVAVELARLRKATLVLGSATPSVDTLQRCLSDVDGRGLWKRVRLIERPNGKPLPPVCVVDMAKEFKQGSRSMFSAALTAGLEEVIERDEKAVLLLNQRGFASFMLCRECGYVPECPQCSTSLNYHEVGNVLACHHCDHKEQAPTSCPKCGSPYLRKFGAGTQRVEDELRALLPEGTSITRMDADTTKGKGAHERLLEEFRSAQGGVLLGTQMIAKGLDFPDVTLVGVINADTTLKLPDFRAAERTYQLLEQVSGRAGRAEKDGRVIVQTYWPTHPAIRAAAAHDRDIFLDEEIPARRELSYPPFSRMANVLVWGKSEADVRRTCAELALAIDSACASAGVEWRILGPAPCLLERLRGVYRWHILLKALPGTDFSTILQPLLAKRKTGSEVRCAVDVDPFSLF